MSRKTQEHNFLSAATLIGGVTLLSRILGYAREKAAAHFFGTGPVWEAFVYAFRIPNLFRKLLGEGALSQAFIPLYAGAVKRNDAPGDFAAASVNLLMLILTGVTVVGELILLAMARFGNWSDETRLAITLTSVMLPYVMLVCGAAFLSGILQVHKRFAAPAATAIVLNFVQIVAMALLAWRYDLGTPDGARLAVWWLSACVLASGFLQIGILLPDLYRSGFRFRLAVKIWTPLVKKMLLLSLPVALSASVLQIGVFLDGQISYMLTPHGAATTFTLFGHTFAYPMTDGAIVRLNWAQFMYQFPLGVFAIAIATAIFPKLSEDAINQLGVESGESRVADQRSTATLHSPLTTENFRNTLRRGIEAAMFIGLPASVGMVIIAFPAVRLLFEGGRFTLADARWTALSTAIYSAAIWAFSVQQILNRGYYALHDARTPLIWTIVNLLLNLVVEIPLAFTGLGESAMAVGTLVSFAVQTTIMTAMLCRRVQLHLKPMLMTLGKMLIASAVMGVACYATRAAFPSREALSHVRLGVEVVSIMSVGGIVYFGMCQLLGLPVWSFVRRKKA
ncbi:MAG: murein biosynthesis integral membrane protein MurJ [Tepidisphaeraceae bacterium]